MHRTFDGTRVRHYLGPIRLPGSLGWLMWGMFMTSKSKTFAIPPWSKKRKQV